MKLTEADCPKCLGKGEVQSLSQKDKKLKCAVCLGAGVVPYFEVLLEEIRDELVRMNSTLNTGKKR